MPCKRQKFSNAKFMPSLPRKGLFYYTIYCPNSRQGWCVIIVSHWQGMSIVKIQNSFVLGIDWSYHFDILTPSATRGETKMCKYKEAQVKRIIDKADEKGDTFIRLQVECDSVTNKSHWLNIPMEQARQIMAIMATIPE